MRHLIIALAIALTSTAATAVTIEERITQEPNKTITEILELPAKTLVNPKIIGAARRAVEDGIALDWDEGSRSLTRFDETATDDLKIKRLKTRNGVVEDMDVIVNIVYAESNEGVEREAKAKCEVFLEKIDRIFESNYFLCITADGEEIEWER